MSDHEAMENEVATWVLGAMDARDAEEMRVHVEGCASCTQVAMRFRRAVAALPLEVEEMSPPARLRERVLVAATAARSSTIPSAPARKKTVPAMPRFRPIATIQVGRLYAAAAAATVLLALLIGLAAGALVGRNSVIAPPPQVARFTLEGHGPLAGAHGTVIDLKNDGVTLVDFKGLPALAKGKVYEVWLISAGGRAAAAAVFVPDSNGAKVVLVNMPLSGFAQMAVTTEDGPDGATAPTQPPQLYGPLA